MTEPMTPDPSPLLDEIQARADAATEGPWEAATSEATMNDRSEYRFGVPSRPQAFRASMRFADAAFIAAARTDLPRLVAAVRAALEGHRRRMDSASALHPAPLCSCGQPYPCPTVTAITEALEER